MIDIQGTIQGTWEPRFEPVVDELREQLERYGGGVSACVYEDGKPVVDVWGGISRLDGTPWKRDTLVITYSTTKGVTSTALHVLASEGKIDYDAPVATYWPEFAQNGKEAITVRQLLSHQAGLHKMRRLVRRASHILDWDHMVGELARARPVFHPGSANAYHALTFGWLVGEIVQRVAGQMFADFLRERIQEPLELDGLFIGAPRSELHRIADVLGLPPLRREHGVPFRRRYRVPLWIPPGPARTMIAGGFHPRQLRRLFAHPEFWTTPIPAANGVFTARSLARLYATLAGGGELDGVRLMSPETVSRMAEVQTTRMDRVTLYPLHWRLGYHRADPMFKAVPEAFGHLGLGGAGGWANPAKRLAGAIVHNGNPLSIPGQIRSVRFTGSVYNALGEYDGLIPTLRAGERTVFHPVPDPG